MVALRYLRAIQPSSILILRDHQFFIEFSSSQSSSFYLILTIRVHTLSNIFMHEATHNHTLSFSQSYIQPSTLSSYSSTRKFTEQKNSFLEAKEFREEEKFGRGRRKSRRREHTWNHFHHHLRVHLTEASCCLIGKPSFSN